MTTSIQRPGTLDVTVANPNNILYIIGNEVTDGSIRFIFESPDNEAHVEKRENGVWNDTSLRFSGASVLVGRDLKIEAAADFIKTSNPSGFAEHDVGLILHVPFGDEGTMFPHTPIVDALFMDVIFSGPVSEIIDTTITQVLAINFAQIIKSIVYEVGTIGASSEVVQTIYKGTDNTGSIIDRQNISAVDFLANTTAIIDLNSSIGFSDMHPTVFIELVSDNSFALKTDVGNNLILSLDTQTLEKRDLLYEDLILTNDLSFTFNNSLEFVYHEQFAP